MNLLAREEESWKSPCSSLHSDFLNHSHDNHSEEGQLGFVTIDEVMQYGPDGNGLIFFTEGVETLQERDRKEAPTNLLPPKCF